MRRFVAGVLLIFFMAQSSGAARATTTGGAQGPSFTIASLIKPVLNGIVSSSLYATFTGTTNRYAAMHAPSSSIAGSGIHLNAAKLIASLRPLRPRVRIGEPVHVTMPPLSALNPHHRRLDPLAMRRSRVSQSISFLGSHDTPIQPLHTPLSKPALQNIRPHAPRQGAGLNPMTSGSSGTGIEHWWTYQQRAIPGIGKAMVNVGTGNLVVSTMDVDIPERGIDLAFQRVYNMQSLHDYAADDGGDRAIFGNRWTNNFDANMVYDSVANTITVYDLNGTACTYASDGQGGWVPCTGRYESLEPTDGTDCTYAWTKKNGTIYWFHADNNGGNCGLPLAKKGHLQEILARNNNSNITFTYSYDGSGKGPEDVTEIDANHSDGRSLTMSFGLIPGTAINELSTIRRPDGAVLQYLYDATGNLVEVDKPGNNSAGSIANAPSTLPQGDLPETYAYATGSSTLQEVCGPRCTVATWNNPNNPKDGGALLFTANSSLQLTSWQFQGVLNFTPQDGTSTVLQSSAPTGFVPWYTANFVYGQGSACSNSSVGTTTMCDTDGHSTIWTTDSSNRVSQTQDWTGTAESVWLVTGQTWDAKNDLISSTDANGNTTKYGYDTGGYNQGNMVEMQLPRASDVTDGPLSALSYYSFDQYHNVIAYCDPVYNQNNGKVWVDSPGDNLCPGGNKTTILSYNQTTSEPTGCLTSITKPSGYSTNLAYGGGNDACGVGLPAQVEAAQAITQYDNTTRTPTQDFGYDGHGNLTSYDRGTQNGNVLDSWTLTYDTENLLMQRAENDPTIPLSGSSFTCHYPDGSILYTETPSQHDADGDSSCPSTQTLLGGSFSPPSKATSFFYDTDGNQVKVITHKGCSSNNACPQPVQQTTCSSGEMSNPIGTMCKYYDGLDRLVESTEPYDTRTFGLNSYYEFYAFRWANRYLYDLSQAGGSANLRIADNTGTVSNLLAYGNLYKTQEYLPQTQNMVAVLSHGQYGAGTAAWSDVRGTSFDGLDRPVGKYELAYGTIAITASHYDQGGDLGNLTSVRNALGQITSYSHDTIDRVENVTFSGAAPLADGRSYTFDANGRTASASNSLGKLSYTFDVDGNELSVTEPANQAVYAASLICYKYYSDGVREYLSIGSAAVNNCSAIQQQKSPSNGGISQPNIFSYSYEHDGRLATKQVNWISSKATFSWTYTPSGRELSQTDPLYNAKSCLPPSYTICTTFGRKAYQYDSYGRVGQLTLPEGYQETNFIYDTDDETAGYTDNGSFNRKLTLNARGELIADGAGALQTAQAATMMANGTQVGNGDQLVDGNAYEVSPSTLQYDVRSGMVTVVPDPGWANGIGGDDVNTYDSAGRRTETDWWYQWPNPPSQQRSTTQYDAENHIETTKASGNLTGTVQWGSDARDRLETVSNSFPPNTSTVNAAHWDGDSLLFAGSNQSGDGPGSPVLYIGKLGVMDSNGDLNIIDRDQAGAQQTTHGDLLSGGFWYEGWSLGSLRAIQVYFPKAQKPVNVQIATGSCDFYGPAPAYQYYPCAPLVAPTFGMGRTDGYTMYGGVVQGARTFDPTSGQWLTPDAYAGDVRDPMSQKPFMWNGNNPVQFSDPSGYYWFDNGNPSEQKQFADEASALDRKVVETMATIKDTQSSEYKQLQNLHNDLQPGSGGWHVTFGPNPQQVLSQTFFNIIGARTSHAQFASPATDPSNFDSHQLAGQSQAQYESAIVSEAGAYELASGIDGTALQNKALQAGVNAFRTLDDNMLDHMTNSIFAIPLGLPIDE